MTFFMRQMTMENVKCEIVVLKYLDKGIGVTT